MIVALYALSVAATVLAWALARRHAEHRPVAALLTIGLGADLATRALRAFYFSRVADLPLDAPWTSTPRIMGHVADAVLLAWPAALAGAALPVFVKRRPWGAVAGYALAVGALVRLHPIAGDGSLGRALTACNLVALAIAIGCAATWYLGTGSKRERADVAQACMILILSIELPSLAGAWHLDIFRNWHLSRIAYLVLYSLLVVIQGGWLCSLPRSSRSS